MKITKYNIHLWISIPIVFSAGLSYGFYPETLLDLHPETLDEQSFNKAIMGLYFGFATFWCLGLFKKSLHKSALISHVCFMLLMAFGRLLSIILDGVPSGLYVYGTIGEFFLGFYGLWVLRKMF